MIDKFYTPADICAMAYQALSSDGEGLTVGDFSCGDGALLSAAPVKRRKIIGLDVDQEAINDLRIKNPTWELHCGDFLNPDCDTDIYLSRHKGTLDLVVLNPPFSCLSGQWFTAEIDGISIRCSKSMAFLSKSLDFLSEDGSAMAIMPLSCLRSTKDSQILKSLRQKWRITLGQELARKTFKGCRPKSICMVLQRRNDLAESFDQIDLCRSKLAVRYSVSLMRGCTPMFKCGENGQNPVIHTNNLRHFKGNVRSLKQTSVLGRSVKGTVLIIPRVGLPDIRKVRAIDFCEPVTLSDCLYAIQAETPLDTKKIEGLVRDNWEQLESLYQSTCAPYLTIPQLSDFLWSIGIESKMATRELSAGTSAFQSSATLA